jgi:hypothetical protein
MLQGSDDLCGGDTQGHRLYSDFLDTAALGPQHTMYKLFLVQVRLQQTSDIQAGGVTENKRSVISHSSSWYELSHMV